MLDHGDTGIDVGNRVSKNRSLQFERIGSGSVTKLCPTNRPIILNANEQHPAPRICKSHNLFIDFPIGKPLAIRLEFSFQRFTSL